MLMFMFQGQTSTKDFRVNKLLKDSSYKFRVCAVNSEGQGPWEEGAATIQAKDPYGRCSQLCVCSQYFQAHAFLVIWCSNCRSKQLIS